MLQQHNMLENEGYSRIMYISCIDKPRTKKEIMRLWGMSENSKMLYKEETEESVHKMIQEGLMDKESFKHSSKFNEEFLESMEDQLARDSILALGDILGLRKGLFHNRNVLEAMFTEKEALIEMLHLETEGGKTALQKIFDEENLKKSVSSELDTSKKLKMVRDQFWTYFQAIGYELISQTSLKIQQDLEEGKLDEEEEEKYITRLNRLNQDTSGSRILLENYEWRVDFDINTKSGHLTETDEFNKIEETVRKSIFGL